MPLRNPFRSKPNDQVYDEHGRPVIVGRSDSSLGSSEHWSSRAKPISVRTNSSDNSERRQTEYKMSEINDSGEFIPPSPTEKKATFWSQRSAASTRSSSTLNDSEPFNISRESFDSYRRSFDISARSPILTASPTRPRQSLDVRSMRLPPHNSATSSPKPTQRTSLDRPRRPSATPYQPKLNSLPDNHINPPTREPEEPEDTQSVSTSPNSSVETGGVSTNPTTPSDTIAERFEDVGLGEPVVAGKPDPAFKKPLPPQHPKKPSIFARFGASSDSSANTRDESAKERPASGGLGIGLGMFGRKRGTSGQGAELGNFPQQASDGRSKRDSLVAAGAQEVKVDP